MPKTRVPLCILMCLLLIACQWLKPAHLTVREQGACASQDDKTREPQGIAEVFSLDSDRLMVFIYVETNLDAVAQYAWYHEDILVDTASAPLESGYNYSWLNSEGAFPVGSYRVIVSVGDEPPMKLAEIAFRVVGDSDTP